MVLILEKDNQKTDSDSTTANLTADSEEEILNRFDTAEPDIDSAIDEDALLNDKQDDIPKQNKRIEEAVNNANVPEDVTEKEEIEQKKIEETEKVVINEPESNCMLDTKRMEVEEDLEQLSENIKEDSEKLPGSVEEDSEKLSGNRKEDPKKLPGNMEEDPQKLPGNMEGESGNMEEDSETLPGNVEEDPEKVSGNNDLDELYDEDSNVDESEQLRRSNNADRLRNLESVTKDLKDTVDTEDLLQVTDVKEADANESSSSSSSEKDDSEEAAEQSLDDNNERDYDNDDLIDRPSESMDCGDMMDIEENNPLGVEVSEEMDKDYENLLNSEKSNELSKELENANTENESNEENVAESIVEKNSKSNKVVCNGDASTAEKKALNEKINNDDEAHISETQGTADVSTDTVTDETTQAPHLSCTESILHNETCGKFTFLTFLIIERSSNGTFN